MRESTLGLLGRRFVECGSFPEAATLAALATVAFDIRFTLFSIQGVQIPILLFELPLALLLVWAVSDLIHKRWRPRTTASRLGVVLAALLMVSAVVHPSWFTLLRLFRFAAAAAFAYSIFTVIRGGGRKQVYVVAAIVALFQSYLATGQHVLAKGMGYTFLGEGEYLYGGGVPPLYAHGTFPLHHILAGFAMAVLGLLMATSRRPRRWWLVVPAGAAIPIGFAHSRMGAVAWLSVVAVVGVASIKQKALYLGLFTAILCGGILPGLVALDGWAARTTETIRGEGAGGDDEGVDVGGRLTFALQGIRVIRDAPLLGTGIGRYLSVAQHQLGEDVQEVVHNVPLLVAAENGILSGAVAVLLLGVAGAVAVRAGPLPLAIFLTYLPFILLDHFPYDDTQGIALTGIWTAATAGSIEGATT